MPVPCRAERMRDTMENDNCERLFEYLRSILYDPQIQAPEVETLDESFRKLGRGLQFLQQAVEELRSYSAALSNGNLSAPCPPKENPLCANLKNLHANLNHLTWQAKQVAAGDYSQHVSYLGEFSDAFNMMTAQLKEREALLQEEAEKMRERAEAIEGYNELLREMTRKRNEWIFVVDAASRTLVYCNKCREETEVNPVLCENCVYRLSFRSQILNWQDSGQFKVWELGDEKTGYYRINTFPIEWKGLSAYAHIVSDITDEKRTENNLTSKAYIDSGTGIRNRLFFEEYMEKLLQDGRDITLCYLDLDGLIYVNDQYGHTEGDNYIRRFVSAAGSAFRGMDVFARVGGDEFAIVLPDGDIEGVKKRIAGVLERFIEENDKDYPMSFSYGVVEIEGGKNRQTLEEIIQMADAEMYKCKRENKKKFQSR